MRAARAPGRPRGSKDRHGKAQRVPIRSDAYARHVAAIGERIRDIREERDVARSELAAALNVWESTVTNWENGSTRRVPTLRRLVQIAQALDCMVIDLIPQESP